MKERPESKIDEGIALIVGLSRAMVSADSDRRIPYTQDCEVLAMPAERSRLSWLRCPVAPTFCGSMIPLMLTHFPSVRWVHTALLRIASPSGERKTGALPFGSLA